MAENDKPGRIVNPQTGQSIQGGFADNPKGGSSRVERETSEEKKSVIPSDSFQAGEVKYRDKKANPGSRKLILGGIALSSLLILLGLLFALKQPLQESHLSSKSFSSIAQNLPVIGPYFDHGKKQPDANSSSSEANSFIGMDCKETIEKALSLKVNGLLSEVGRVALARCYLIQDSFLSSQNILNNFSNLSMRDSNVWSKIDIEGYHLYLETLISRWNFTEASEQVFLHCRGWQWTPGCVGKLIVYARTGRHYDAEKGFLKLKGAGDRFGRKSLIRVLVSGGVASRKQGKFGLASKRLWEAAAMLKKQDYLLARSIFSEILKVSYFSRNSIEAKKGFQFYRQFVPKVKRRNFSNIDILYAIQRPKLSKRALQIFFTKRSMYQRYMGDAELVAIVAYEGIRVELAKEVGSYMVFMQKHLVEKHSISEVTSHWLGRWVVRSMIAQGRFEEAISILNLVRKKGLKGPEHYFLRGLSFLNYGEFKKHRLFALAEFQRMINLSNEWQAYYGAISSLIPLKDASKINYLFKNWPGLGPQKEGRKWYQLARMKAALSLNDKKASAALAEQILREYPDFVEGISFLEGYYRQQGNQEKLALVLSLQKKHPTSNQGINPDNPLSPLTLSTFTPLQ